jgi:hypothetical protein
MRAALLSVPGAVAALALPGVAGAAPDVTLGVRALPIPGFAHTGNIAGAGASFELELRIQGNEYRGFPPGLVHANVYLPAGTGLDPSGFPTCDSSTLGPSGSGPKACPPGSTAGDVGQAQVGIETPPEAATIEPFFAPGGGLTFLTFGHNPWLVEILFKAHYVRASPPYGEKLEIEVGPNPYAPAGRRPPYRQIKTNIGTALNREHRTFYYLRMPSACPQHYLPFESELTFEGVESVPVQTVTTRFRAPCPRRAYRRRHHH